MRIDIRQTNEADWLDLKKIRLESLMDAPRAFGLTYEAASAYTDDQWRQRAGNQTPPVYFLARDGARPIGVIGVRLQLFPSHMPYSRSDQACIKRGQLITQCANLERAWPCHGLLFQSKRIAVGPFQVGIKAAMGCLLDGGP